MAKQVVYLELSQGNASNQFLCIEVYRYGTDEEFKTFNQAIKKAQKDFSREVKIHLKQSFNGIGKRNALRIIDADKTVYNKITIEN